MSKGGIENAILVAAYAHRGQRDLGGNPYIFHPLRVTEAARAAGESEAVQIVCVLHDVVEDTKVTALQIADSFGIDIAAAVVALTHYRGEDYLTSYLSRVVSDPLAHRAKPFDIYDNMPRPPLGDGTDEARNEKYRKALHILETSWVWGIR